MHDGPNFNSVMIAFFGFLSLLVSAIAAHQSAKLNRDLRRNTAVTYQARDAAQAAADHTNGGLSEVVTHLVKEALAAEVRKLKEGTKERPPVPPVPPA